MRTKLIPVLLVSVFASTLTILLNSCAPKQNQRTASTPTPGHLPMRNWGDASVEFTAEIKPREDANRYAVALKWKSIHSPGAWAIQKADGRKTAKSLATLEGKQTTFVDDQVEADKTYHYTLGVLEPAGYMELKEISVTIAHDIAIFEDQTVQGEVLAKRLFIGPNDWAITNGVDTEIVVDEIISDEGVVSTFPDTRTAQPALDGRSGGKLTIRAKRGRGVIHIMSRGENGGSGRQGPIGGNGPKGARGSAGRCETISLLSLPERIMNLVFTPAYADRDRNEGRLNPQPRSVCRAHPGDGLPGGSGLQGGPGDKGGRGGDSARVLVTIDEPANIHVKTWVDVGQGGTGGPGGLGGTGGPGGDPGERVCEPCRAASPGPQGPSGPVGPNGSSGNSGKEQPMCLKLGSAIFGDCRAFDR